MHVKYRNALRCLMLLVLTASCAALAQNRGTPDVVPLPGFSCPPAKLWDLDGTTREAVCVDCRGVQPPPEQRNVACEANKIGTMLEGRDFFCQANAWRPGPWQLISDTCRCDVGYNWDGSQCLPVRGLDVCRNLPGDQPVVPPGYIFVPPDRCLPVDPPFDIASIGLMWQNGAQPYWNTLMNQLNARVPDWNMTPAPNDYIKQAVDYLGNRWTLGPCVGDPVRFGNIEVVCEKSWEDIVSTRTQRGPFYLIRLGMRRI